MPRKITLDEAMRNPNPYSMHFREFRDFLDKAGLPTELAVQQWKLYWEGVRDYRLHDASYWLIERFGM